MRHMHRRDIESVATTAHTRAAVQAAGQDTHGVKSFSRKPAVCRDTTYQARIIHTQLTPPPPPHTHIHRPHTAHTCVFLSASAAASLSSSELMSAMVGDSRAGSSGARHALFRMYCVCGGFVMGGAVRVGG